MTFNRLWESTREKKGIMHNWKRMWWVIIWIHSWRHSTRGSKNSYEALRRSMQQIAIFVNFFAHENIFDITVAGIKTKSSQWYANFCYCCSIHYDIPIAAFTAFTPSIFSLHVAFNVFLWGRMSIRGKSSWRTRATVQITVKVVAISFLDSYSNRAVNYHFLGHSIEWIFSPPVLRSFPI